MEAKASLGAQYFYNRHPEVALRHYSRLLQMGVQNEFYALQYDILHYHVFNKH